MRYLNIFNLDPVISCDFSVRGEENVNNVLLRCSKFESKRMILRLACEYNTLLKN